MPIEIKPPKAFSVELGILECSAGRNGVGALAVLWCQELRLCLRFRWEGEQEVLVDLTECELWVLLLAGGHLCSPWGAKCAGGIYSSLHRRNDLRRCLLPFGYGTVQSSAYPAVGCFADGRGRDASFQVGNRDPMDFICWLLGEEWNPSLTWLCSEQSQINKQYFYFYKTCPEERGKALQSRNDFVASTGYCWKEIIPVHWPEAKPCLIPPVLKFWVLERGLTETGYTFMVTMILSLFSSLYQRNSIIA